MIYFNEGTHTYVNTENGRELISVTTLLGKYKPKFDKKENVINARKSRIMLPKSLWDTITNIKIDKKTNTLR